MSTDSKLTQEVMKVGSSTCSIFGRLNSRGIWFGDDPLDFSLPLLLLQLSLICIFSRSLHALFKNIDQPSVVSQIVAGVILGPSVLGRSAAYAVKVFPPKGKILLDTLAVFGLMLFVFLLGVKTDPTIFFKSGKRPLAIGILGFFVPYALAGLVAFVLNHFLSLDHDISNVLHLVAVLQSLTSFPVIASFLAELKLLNSELGRLASCSSIVSDMCHWFIVAVRIATRLTIARSLRTAIGATFSTVLLVIFFVVGIRPAALWAIRNTPEGKPVKEIYISVVLIALLFCGFMGEVIGINAFITSFVLGLFIPDGPPLGAALVERMPLRDAFSLGIIMNSKGITELAILVRWKEHNVINEECFTILVISLLIVTGAITPLTNALYDTSKRFLAYKRRTILHHRNDEELRILACIHTTDNVRAVLNLLSASNPSKESPINLAVLHLIKLVGRASPLLIACVSRENKSQYSTQSEQIFNAFRKFEQHYSGHVIVHCYKGISPYATMHNDVCSLALEKRTTFIVIPFHKQWVIGGRVESSNTLRHLNNNVLDKAPCSVGVLIDRGNQRKPWSILGQPSMYRVAVLFFGGADDREVLAYAGRMYDDHNVLITLLRFYSSSEIVGGTARSKILDTEILSQFRLNAFRNQRVSYQEEMVMDGNGVLAVLRSMENAYDLVMVGRRHQDSQLMSDLGKCIEHGELGAIGDTLAAKDFRGAASVLVVQQQTKLWGLNDPEDSTRLRRVNI
ncbi:cation/H(+) antiporter 15-like isoform X2 [Castanea sativa]|uniref:cation/H(+) antiporter 15-like isoform X2 n=1 Tax=Castanea sativa TaxID=21020 RepID=UPI003F64A2C1